MDVFIDVLILHPWKMWPLWVGPLLVIGSPFIVLALHLPLLLLLPCILLLSSREDRRQRSARATIQMEEGRRANQIHIDAANAAEAARLAAERAAQPEGDGTGAGAEASPPAIDTGGTDASPPDDNVSTDRPPPSGVAEPEPVEKPPPENDVGGAIVPPEPVHIGPSTRKS
jgi:hypothetical protein